MDSILAIPQDLTAAMLSGTAVTAGSRNNLLSNRVGLVARWAGTVGAYYVDIDLGTAKAVDFVAALWSNLRSTDNIVITAGATVGATTYSSGALNPHYNGSTRTTSAGTKSILALPAPQTYRYWRITFNVAGTSLPEGYLEVSRIVLGNRLNFAVDYSGIELFDDDRGQVDQAEYGEDIETVRRISFGWRARWKFGSQAELLSSHQRLVMLGKTKPIFFLPMPSAANAQDLAAFGKMRNPARTQSAAYDIWELGFDVVSDAA